MDVLRKAPTIQDVARAASVSTATVSRALSAPDMVSDATLARVNDAVKKLGYTKNAAAQSLRSKVAKTLLIVLPDLGNPFFSPIVDSVERTAAHHGYDILVANRKASHDADRSIAQYMRANRVDGLLMFDGGMSTQDLKEALRFGSSAPFPALRVCELPTEADIAGIKVDNAGGIRLAIDELVRLGHKSIGHIAGPASNVVTMERQIGFEDGLARHRLRSSDQWNIRADFSFSAGRAAGRAFCSLEDRPTAVVCDSDEIAIGFMNGCRELGVECPRDVSVVGFDNIPFAAEATPALTTIGQPHAEIGRVAAERLIGMVELGSKQKNRIVLPCTLVQRQSTRALSWNDRNRA